MTSNKEALKKLLDSNSSTRYKNLTSPHTSSIRSTASSSDPHPLMFESNEDSSVTRSIKPQTQFNNYLLHSYLNSSSKKLSSCQFEFKESILCSKGEDVEADFDINKIDNKLKRKSAIKEEEVKRDVDVWKGLQQTLEHEKEKSSIHSYNYSDIYQPSQTSLKGSSEFQSSLFHQKSDHNSSRTTHSSRPISPTPFSSFNSSDDQFSFKPPHSSVFSASVEYWNRSVQSNFELRNELTPSSNSPRITPQSSSQSSIQYSPQSNSNYHDHLHSTSHYSPTNLPLSPSTSQTTSHSENFSSDPISSFEYYLPRRSWANPSSPSPSSPTSSMSSFATTSTGSRRLSQSSLEDKPDLSSFETNLFEEHVQGFGETMENNHRILDDTIKIESTSASTSPNSDSKGDNQVVDSIELLKSEVAESVNLEVAPVRTRAPKERRVYTCPVSSCGKVFVRPSALATHNRSHDGYRPFVCPLIPCSRPFSVFSNLKRHVLTHPEIDFKSVSISDLPQFMIDSRASQLALSASRNAVDGVAGGSGEVTQMVWINQTPGFC